MRDCVVELVGLEPTSKVLWNMVGVRPTPWSDTHPDCGSFAVLLDFPGFLTLDQPPEYYGTWFESDRLPWSDTRTTTKVLWNMGLSDRPTSSDTLKELY